MSCSGVYDGPLNEDANSQQVTAFTDDSNDTNALDPGFSHLNKLNQHTYEFAPINRLPSEVLAQIFRHFMHRRSSAEWCLIEQVCTSWRRIIIGYPLFWTVIQGAGLTEARTFLRRSGDQPLDIFYADMRMGSKTFALLISERYRIRQLVLHFENDARSHALLVQSMSSSDIWTKLELLSISASMIAWRILATSGIQLAVPHTLMAPRLHHLSLKWCCLDTSHMPAGYTHLRTLRFEGRGAESGPSL
jgi:hypothetical protein